MGRNSDKRERRRSARVQEETQVRAARSAVVLVFNDACYGAEIHQYGSQGLDETIMEIEEADFAARRTTAQEATATRVRVDESFSCVSHITSTNR